MKSKPFKISILSGASLFLMLAGTASATTFTYTVVGGGFADGHACLTSEVSGACASNATFEVGPGDSFPISGTFAYDDVASTIDVDITLATATMFGSHDGISEVIFTDVNYVVNAMPVTLALTGMLFAGPGAGTVTGTYEQSDGVTTVLGPDAINGLSAFFNNFSCMNLDAVGLCGFTVGASRDFALSVGQTGLGDSTDFVQTFNFNAVIPEPTTVSLLALGLAGFAFAPRLRR